MEKTQLYNKPYHLQVTRQQPSQTLPTKPKNPKLHQLHTSKRTPTEFTPVIQLTIWKLSKSIKSLEHTLPNSRASSLTMFASAIIFSPQQPLTRRLILKLSNHILAENSRSPLNVFLSSLSMISTQWRWKITPLPWTSSTQSSKLRCAIPNCAKLAGILASSCPHKPRHLTMPFKPGQDFSPRLGFSSAVFIWSLTTSLKICPWTTVLTWSMSRHKDLSRRDSATQTRHQNKLKSRRTLTMSSKEQLWWLATATIKLTKSATSDLTCAPKLASSIKVKLARPSPWFSTF